MLSLLLNQTTTKKMKESKLIQMEQRLMQIAKLLNQVADEQSHLRNLAVGTLKTIQKFTQLKPLNRFGTILIQLM